MSFAIWNRAEGGDIIRGMADETPVTTVTGLNLSLEEFTFSSVA